MGANTDPTQAAPNGLAVDIGYSLPIQKEKVLFVFGWELLAMV